MLTHVTPVEFVRSTTSGRTKPAILVCERPTGDTVELVAKFSASCDEGVVDLAREVIAACLASDLGLPIPEPLLVDISPEWADSVADATQRRQLMASARTAFGSSHVGPQFSLWNRGTILRPTMIPMAAATFVFDALIQNPDRHADNPNCLVLGSTFRIFDHELAFSHGLVLGWQPPWKPGGLKALERQDSHIFQAALRRITLDLAPIRSAWLGLSDVRIDEYEQAIPALWQAAAADVESATSLIRGIRDHIDACLEEVQRVLK